MIRVGRGPEPGGLPSIREEELTRFRAIVHASGYDRDSLGTRYTEVKELLWRRQACKCCYCEKLCEAVGNDLEHYRPASRYWWLAWTWENLLFACPNCNRWAKNDEFPLVDEPTRLKAEESPPQGEQPQLVDPASEDPLDSIHFIWDEESMRWLPRPRGASVKGAETIRVLELDRQGLLELIQNHVKDFLMPDVTHLQELMKTGDESTVRKTWNRAVNRALQKTMCYSALAHDVFDHYFPEEERKRWGLRLLRP